MLELWKLGKNTCLQDGWLLKNSIKKIKQTWTCKARFVVRGYEEMMLDENYDIATSSPTSEKRSQQKKDLAVSQSYILQSTHA